MDGWIDGCGMAQLIEKDAEIDDLRARLSSTLRSTSSQFGQQIQLLREVITEQAAQNERLSISLAERDLRIETLQVELREARARAPPPSHSALHTALTRHPAHRPTDPPARPPDRR